MPSRREQMIEKAARVIFYATPAGTTQAREAAANVLDAILPQVSTVEELEALPPRSVVVGEGGDVFARTPESIWPWQDTDGDSCGHLEVRGAGPLTVVWRPES